MEIKLRLGVRGIRYTGITGSVLEKLASVRLRFLRESLSIDVFNSMYLPYEASRTCRKIMADFDYARTKASVEAQRQMMRGL